MRGGTEFRHQGPSAHSPSPCISRALLGKAGTGGLSGHPGGWKESSIPEKTQMSRQQDRKQRVLGSMVSDLEL